MKLYCKFRNCKNAMATLTTTTTTSTKQQMPHKSKFRRVNIVSNVDFRYFFIFSVLLDSHAYSSLISIIVVCLVFYACSQCIWPCIKSANFRFPSVRSFIFGLENAVRTYASGHPFGIKLRYVFFVCSLVANLKLVHILFFVSFSFFYCYDFNPPDAKSSLNVYFR